MRVAQGNCVFSIWMRYLAGGTFDDAAEMEPHGLKNVDHATINEIVVAAYRVFEECWVGKTIEPPTPCAGWVPAGREYSIYVGFAGVDGQLDE